MIDVWQQHDIAPPWPTPASLTAQLTNRGLTPSQRVDLVQHSIARACLFADLPLLSFLLESPLSRELVNLSVQDEDGLGLISQSIIGFGDESERDVDREECIRFLVAQKVSVDTPDNGTRFWAPQAAVRTEWNAHSGMDATPPCCFTSTCHSCCSSFDAWCLSTRGFPSLSHAS